MSEKVLLEIILVLLGLLFVMCGFIWRSHEKQHSKMEEKIEDVLKQRVECGDVFASKEAVKRAWDAIEEQVDKIGDLSERLTVVETHLGMKK